MPLLYLSMQRKKVEDLKTRNLLVPVTLATETQVKEIARLNGLPMTSMARAILMLGLNAIKNGKTLELTLPVLK